MKIDRALLVIVEDLTLKRDAARKVRSGKTQFLRKPQQQQHDEHEETLLEETPARE